MKYIFIGALAGSEDALRPLQFANTANVTGGVRDGASEDTAFTRVKTVADLDQALARATAAGRPVLLDFYADWCVSCKEMEKYTFPDPAVQAALANTLMLQADVTDVDADDQALMQRFGIVGPPTIVFFSADGTEQTSRRIIGFKPAAEFAAHLQAVLRGSPTRVAATVARSGN